MEPALPTIIPTAPPFFHSPQATFIAISFLINDKYITYRIGAFVHIQLLFVCDNDTAKGQRKTIQCWFKVIGLS